MFQDTNFNEIALISITILNKRAEFNLLNNCIVFPLMPCIHNNYINKCNRPYNFKRREKISIFF